MNVSHDNTTGSPDTGPSSALHAVIVTVLYSLSIIGAVMGNLLFIFIIIKRRETRTLTGFLFVNMAAADLMVAFFVMPATMATFFTDSKWLTGVVGVVTCKVFYFGFHVSIAASILSLVFMAIDRYLAVLFSFRNFAKFRRPKLLAVVIWLISMIVMVPAAVLWEIGDEGHCVAKFTVFGANVMVGFYLYLFLLIYLTPLSLITVLYGLVCFKLWRRKMPGLVSSDTEKRRGATKRKVVRALIIITAAFAVCWLPSQVMHLLIAFDYAHFLSLPTIVQYVSFWIGHANSAFNPWLYMLLTDKFRRALCDFFHCKCSSFGIQTDASVKYTQYTSVRDNSLVKRRHQKSRQRGNDLPKGDLEETRM